MAKIGIALTAQESPDPASYMAMVYAQSSLPRLNVGGDERLDSIARRIDEELCQYNADYLRENDSTRKDVATQAKVLGDEAEEIINQMKGMFA